MSKLILASLICALTFSGGLVAGSPEASRSAAQKIERVLSDDLEPGEQLTITEDELNSYIQYDYAPEIPDGVRDLKVQLLKDIAVVEAFIDLEKLPAVRDSSIAMLTARLFRGERKLRARCRFVSADGQGKVEIDRLELDDEPLPDFLVDFLIASTVQPHLTDFELGKPFPLANGLRQIRLEPGKVVLIAGEELSRAKL